MTSDVAVGIGSLAVWRSTYPSVAGAVGLSWGLTPAWVSAACRRSLAVGILESQVVDGIPYALTAVRR
jgi:hypothetical protein